MREGTRLAAQQDFPSQTGVGGRHNQFQHLLENENDPGRQETIKDSIEDLLSWPSAPTVVGTTSTSPVVDDSDGSGSAIPSGPLKPGEVFVEPDPGDTSIGEAGAQADFDRFSSSGSPPSQAQLVGMMRNWYDVSVKPLLIQATSDDRKLLAAIHEWRRWLQSAAVLAVDSAHLSDPSMPNLMMKESEALSLVTDGFVNAIRAADARMVATNDYGYLEDVLKWCSEAHDYGLDEDPTRPLDVDSVLAGLSIRVRIEGIEFPPVLEHGASATLSLLAYTVIGENAPLFDPLPGLRLQISGADISSEPILTKPNVNGRYSLALQRAATGDLVIDIEAAFPSWLEPIVRQRLKLQVPAA
jgi:hypothetical protein